MRHPFESTLFGLVLTAGCAEPPLSYHQDVKPITDAHCVSCHTEGSIAPFALDSYRAVADLAPAVRGAVTERRMPPWHAAPGHRAYRYDPSLSEAKIDIIDRWVGAGAIEGDPDVETAPIELERSVLRRVDVELKAPAAYSPAAGYDDYRCFPMEWPLDRATHISGFEGVPGNLKSVHHLLVFIVPPQSAAQIRAFEADNTDGAPGYPCFGGVTRDGWRPESARDTVLFSFGGQWAPGQGPQPYPEGTGLPIEPGSIIVLQVHYSTLGEGPFEDQSGARFSTVDDVEAIGASMAWMDMQWVTRPATMRIPAGAETTWHQYGNTLAGHPLTGILAPGLDVEAPVRIHGLLPHMHLLGREISVNVQRIDGSEETLVHIPKYDFGWQRAYEFREPLLLLPGDKVEIRCRFDNSKLHRGRMGLPQDPMPDVSWGEGTVDEMCIAMLYLSQPQR